MRRALNYGLLHALVDATTVTVVLRATGSHGVAPQAAIALIICYDMIAFGTQVVLGWLQDRWANPRTGLLTGLALAAASVAVYQAPLTPGGDTATAPAWVTATAPIVAVVLAGLGNAAFHLGAGAQVLRQGLGRAAPAGLFVAPGALGLGFGLLFGKDPSLGPVWPLGLLMLLLVPVAAGLRAPAWPAPDHLVPVDAPLIPPVAGDRLPPPRRLAPEVMYGALVLLLVSIAIRSLVGLSASRGYPKGAWLLVGIPIVGFLGKALGGLLADRFGWIPATGTALLVSAPLLALPGPNPLPLLAGLLAFQMTMPVTLVAVARLMPGRLGTAFGWACLALAVGAAPTMFSWGTGFGTRPMLVGWILLAVFAVVAGLTLAGVTPASRTPERQAPGTDAPPTAAPAPTMAERTAPESGSVRREGVAGRPGAHQGIPG